jgi:hypothetical protein
MWKINDMKRDASTGFVSEVHWSVVAQDGDFSGSVYGSIALTGELTTPYESLTEAQVIGWVKSAMGADTVAAHEAAVAAQIEAQKNPVVAAGLPWAV